ncbi:hypothetical protein CEUSTIGMA_g8145.t1 [Chlamydomonas eustigma]|uniref:Pherophorin domain-containing protein n=1 Tax=Chlamydomonas eustigma TaxID=1157962 RepID=A0A250XD78_9CHLO|nr:hypothetical protein CEUSTIGMA_g8145.t1 [Chlamydomonas eustigma]|eukprot:GAX80710.1 hypothetical protein CEUSTIGMA_g8145.t1 [Chlamydomonas eustigma]
MINPRNVSLLLAVAIAASMLLDRTHGKAIPKPHPPPRPPTPPSPPPPPPPCEVAMQYRFDSTASTSLVNQKSCGIFATQVNKWYSIQSYPALNFSCASYNQTLTISASAATALQQNSARALYKVFKSQGILSAHVFAKVGTRGLSCGDSLTLSSSCINVSTSSITACAPPSTPVQAPTCSITVQLLTSASGQFTSGQCQSLGNSVNLLYGDLMYFTCSAYSNSEISIVSPNNYNNEAVINTLFHNFLYNTTAIMKLATDYGLQCNQDRLMASSSCGLPIQIAVTVPC